MSEHNANPLTDQRRLNPHFPLLLLLFVGSGYLPQGDLYKWGAIHTAACILIYLVVGTPWLLLVAR